MLADAVAAPESAATVPAKADVDQVGRFEERGSTFPVAGRLERWVKEYKGVSVGDSKNK